MDNITLKEQQLDPARHRLRLKCFAWHKVMWRTPALKAGEHSKRWGSQNTSAHSTVTRSGQASLLKQKQRRGLNYLSADSSLCWEANKSSRAFTWIRVTWITSLSAERVSRTASPLTTASSHPPPLGRRRRLVLFQARRSGPALASRLQGSLPEAACSCPRLHRVGAQASAASQLRGHRAHACTDIVPVAPWGKDCLSPSSRPNTPSAVLMFNQSCRRKAGAAGDTHRGANFMLSQP